MTPVEAFAWTFIYMGIAVGVVTVIIVWTAVFYDNKE